MSDADCFLCDECTNTYSTAWGLKKHKNTHLGLKGKTCSYCSKTFPDQLNLEEHKQVEHANGEYSEQFRADAVEMATEVGIEKAASELMLHKSTLTSWMTDDGENYCSECHKSFKFDSYLKNHMKLHDSKCGKPMKTFKEKRFSEALKNQVIDHVKLYSVKSAGKVFGLGDSSLRAILKAGTFPCNLCKRKCAYRGQLQRHMLEVHKIEQLIKVVETKKKVTTFPCTICERKCAYKKQLERHMLVHTVHTNETDNGRLIAVSQKPRQVDQKRDKEIAKHSEIKIETNAERVKDVYSVDDEMFVFETLKYEHTKSESAYLMTETTVPEELKNTKSKLSDVVVSKNTITKGIQNIKREWESEVKAAKTHNKEMCEGQNLKEYLLQKYETEDTAIKPKTNGRKNRKVKFGPKKKKKKYKQKEKTCNHCGVITIDMKRHLVKHDKIKLFKCDQCEKAFGLKFNLKRHIDLHHNPEVELFSCSKCAQRLTTRRTLLMHEARHEKPKCDSKLKSKFQCNVCNDISSTQRKLRKHCAVTKHQILRQFACATCSKAYVDQRELDVHNDVAHLKLTNHPCNSCGKQFGRASSLRAHLIKIHRKKGKLAYVKL